MTGLRQFFSYFGSKVSLAKHYPAPRFDTIVEPFAGSAGYSCLYPDREIILHDIDPVIVGVWKFLIRATYADIMSLPLKPIDVAGLSQAERDFIGFWWRRAGAVPSAKPVPWALSGKWPSSFWTAQTRTRIANQVDRINHWKCSLRPILPNPKWYSTYFIDPPYQQQGKRYTFGSEQMDYADLEGYCRWLQHGDQYQVIVCEASGADWLPFRPLYENRTVKYKKEKRMIQEMVWP